MEERQKTNIIMISSLIILVLIVAFGVLLYSSLKNKTAQEETTYLFVQNAESGTLEIVSGSDNKYKLTFYNASPYTTYFSDKPKRITGQVPNETIFHDGVFGPIVPNAAIEIINADEKQDVIVGEISNPNYDNNTKTLTYDFQVLKDEHTGYIASFDERGDESLPEKFGFVSIFIDSGPLQSQICYANDPTCPRFYHCCLWLQEYRCYAVCPYDT